MHYYARCVLTEKIATLARSTYEPPTEDQT
jgi:hypothetical protein